MYAYLFVDNNTLGKRENINERGSDVRSDREGQRERDKKNRNGNTQ